mmetsp:Transcript_5707/g.14244  ORF Transcript_5707/g.14244 Transcript_5707/m.14244 type:complete len:937 (+) Transcript_5707:83-2893(+)
MPCTVVDAHIGAAGAGGTPFRRNLTLAQWALALGTLATLGDAFTLLGGNGDPSVNVAGVLGAARRWPAPSRFGDSSGLGGGLVYALDATFCDVMLPRFLEESRADDLITLDKLLLNSYSRCDEVEAAVALAFDSWASNHPHISFKRDTSECAGKRDCETTEIFVTVFDQSSERSVPGEPQDKAALAQIRAYEPINPIGCLWPKSEHDDSSPYPLGGITVRRADLRFNQSMCWYLDTAFCALFNSAREGNQLAPKTTGLVTMAIALWSFAVLYIIRLAYLLARGNAVKFDSRYRWRALQVPDEALNGVGRRERVVFIAAKWRPDRIAFALSLIVVIPLVWKKVATPCLDCYDFAASAAHELGHILGIAHPNESPSLSLLFNSTEGRRDVACGLGQNGSLTIGKGTPFGSGGYSIMEPVTQFVPKACIGQDDLDALNALYPACDGSGTGNSVGSGAVLEPPRCAKVRPSSGVARLLGVVLWPTLFVSIGVFVLLHLVRRRAMATLQAIDKFLDASVVLPYAGHVHIETARRLAELLATTEREMRDATGLTPSQLFGATAVPGTRRPLPPPKPNIFARMTARAQAVVGIVGSAGRERRITTDNTADGGPGGDTQRSNTDRGPNGNLESGDSGSFRTDPNDSLIHRAYQLSREEYAADQSPPPPLRARILKRAKAPFVAAKVRINKMRGIEQAPAAEAEDSPEAMDARAAREASARSTYLASSLGSLAYIEAVSHAVANRSARENAASAGGGTFRRHRSHRERGDGEGEGAGDGSSRSRGNRRREAEVTGPGYFGMSPGGESAQSEGSPGLFLANAAADAEEEAQMREAITMSLTEARALAATSEAAELEADVAAIATAEAAEAGRSLTAQSPTHRLPPIPPRGPAGNVHDLNGGSASVSADDPSSVRMQSPKARRNSPTSRTRAPQVPHVLPVSVEVCL